MDHFDPKTRCNCLSGLGLPVENDSLDSEIPTTMIIHHLYSPLKRLSRCTVE